VLAVQVGTTVDFSNLDRMFHNVVRAIAIGSTLAAPQSRDLHLETSREGGQTCVTRF
jgi:plastocyanin